MNNLRAGRTRFGQKDVLAGQPQVNISSAAVLAIQGKQGPTGEPGSRASISTDEQNLVTEGSDGGIFVEDVGDGELVGGINTVWNT